MSRPVFVIPFLALALQVSQAQLVSHGAPASVLSPTPDGVQRGAPASVVSPAPLAPGVHTPMRTGGAGVHVRGPMRHFGSGHRPPIFVPVPLFYGIYNDGAYPSPADPYVADNQPDPTQTNSADANSAPAATTQADQRSSNQPMSSEDELRAAYLQGAHDAMTYQGQGNSRYGEHYLDSRERQQTQSDAERRPRQQASTQPEFSMVPAEDKTPTTVFIFKDGHQVETKNYAIMGGTLFDFSGATLKKIKLDDLDSSATVKANDDRGVQVKLN